MIQQLKYVERCREWSAVDVVFLSLAAVFIGLGLYLYRRLHKAGKELERACFKSGYWNGRIEAAEDRLEPMNDGDWKRILPKHLL